MSLAVRLMGQFGDDRPRELGPDQLEVAVLDRARPRRAFQRVTGTRLEELLQAVPGGSAT